MLYCNIDHKMSECFVLLAEKAEDILLLNLKSFKSGLFLSLLQQTLKLKVFGNKMHQAVLLTFVVLKKTLMKMKKYSLECFLIIVIVLQLFRLDVVYHCKWDGRGYQRWGEKWERGREEKANGKLYPPPYLPTVSLSLQVGLEGSIRGSMVGEGGREGGSQWKALSTPISAPQSETRPWLGVLPHCTKCNVPQFFNFLCFMEGLKCHLWHLCHHLRKPGGLDHPLKKKIVRFSRSRNMILSS